MGRWGSMKDHSSSQRSVWYAFLMLGILPSEYLRTSFQTVSRRSSKNASSTSPGDQEPKTISSRSIDSCFTLKGAMSAPTTPLKVMLVEDETAFRQALAFVLAKEHDL